MKFPDWVENTTDMAQRARNRLQYLIAKTAVEVTGKNSIRALASHAGMDHSVITYSIRRGQFSAESAVRLEDFAGREMLRNEWLRRPLEIEAATV